MSLTLVTAPAAYPITHAETKDYLNVEHSDDDALIDGLIAAATEYAEYYTARDLIERTWDYSFNNFTRSFCLPKNPVQSVTSITYIDANTSPESQTIATTVYTLDAGVTPATIQLQYNQFWPTPRSQHNAVTVRFITGYAGLGSPQDLLSGS